MQPNPAGALREAVEFIAGNISAHKILVFCNEGVGRSPLVVVAYLCCELGYDFGQAVERVARCKPYMSILPNLILRIEEMPEHLIQCVDRMLKREPVPAERMSSDVLKKIHGILRTSTGHDFSYYKNSTVQRRIG